MNKKLLTGIIFILFAVVFGIGGSVNYRIGTLDNLGPALFPILVSCLLTILGIINIVESIIFEKVAVNIRAKNIGIITLSLIAFALISQYVNMLLGIIALTVIASFCATSYSIARVVKIVVGLIIVAYAFKYLLGLNLPI
jgi:hypothetical protein